MRDLAAFWEDIDRTFPGSRMTGLLTETFGCGHYTPQVRTGEDSVLQLDTIDLGPLPRPRAEIEQVRAYALARHLIEKLDRNAMVDLMQLIKQHESTRFVDAVRNAYKKLSTDT